MGLIVLSEGVQNVDVAVFCFVSVFASLGCTLSEDVADWVVIA